MLILFRRKATEDGGCRRAHFSLLNSVRCPSVMVELGYATHPEEGTRLSTEEYQI
ncbi:MAG: N-acetylmuramoyl-L-alanine amidase, partial [Bacteroidaceae bacterium]|nr:N-acetylmuramoyl-L-alanine amidase [Bacteroidaceae bacterium]